MKFPNLARRQIDKEKATAAEIGKYACVCGEVDNQVFTELALSGVKAKGPHEWLRNRGEVPTAYIGTLCLWSFERYWKYWVAKGPGIPADKAEEFHKIWGKEVRVDGHCECPSPLEWCHGFAVGTYHIDTQAGLNAFAELLKSIYKP